MNSGDSARHPVRVLAVIVLYQKSIQDCVTLQTLLAAQKSVSAHDLSLKILLFDNTPPSVPPSDLPVNIEYRAAAKNSGISVAYNYALGLASREGYDWLITLDQDSLLPQNYLFQLAETARKIADDDSVAAVVPQLSDRGRRLSPYKHGLLRASALPAGFSGCTSGEIHAYNSASMLRVSAIKEVGGFSRLFWLDGLDEWLYTQFSRQNKRVYVVGEIQIEHELSILDVKNRVSRPRYQNFLRAEAAYIDMYRGAAASYVHNLRLVIRWLRNRRAGVDTSLQNVLLDCLKNRLFHSRKQRIAEWTSDMEKLNAEFYASYDF